MNYDYVRMARRSNSIVVNENPLLIGDYNYANNQNVNGYEQVSFNIHQFYHFNIVSSS